MAMSMEPSGIVRNDFFLFLCFYFLFMAYFMDTKYDKENVGLFSGVKAAISTEGKTLDCFCSIFCKLQI